MVLKDKTIAKVKEYSKDFPNNFKELSQNIDYKNKNVRIAIIVAIVLVIGLGSCFFMGDSLSEEATITAIIQEKPLNFVGANDFICKADIKSVKYLNVEKVDKYTYTAVAECDFCYWDYVKRRWGEMQTKQCDIMIEYKGDYVYVKSFD